MVEAHQRRKPTLHRQFDKLSHPAMEEAVYDIASQLRNLNELIPDEITSSTQGERDLDMPQTNMGE